MDCLGCNGMKNIRMDEYCNSVRDGTHDTPKPTETGFYLVTSRAVNNNNIDFSTCYYISENDYNKINTRSKVDKWDIIMTMIGTVGRLMLVRDEPQYAIKNMALFKVGDEDRAKWLYYCLSTKTVQDYFEMIASGTSQHFIGLGHLRKLQIADYIESSKKITDILSAYDDLIEKNNRKIAILQEQAQEIYKEWFVRFRFPGHETAKFENGLPVGWRLMRTVAIGEIVGGGTPSTTNDEYWGGDIPWLTPADLSNNKRVFVGAGSSTISEIGLKCSSTRLLPENTVLLSSRAPVGYVAIAANPICTNQGFKSVICDESIIKPLYLYYFFKNNRELLENYATGSTFPELSATRLKKVKVLVPNDITQKHFEDAVKPILQTANEIEEQIMLLAQQRDLLLPRLMSGKLEA